jgi:opacity protein-like surface antigen
LQAQFRFDWFHLKVSDLKGSMVEVYLGLEYCLFKHVALGAAYDYLDVRADYQKGKRGGWGVENDWNSVFVYGTLYF